MGMKNMAKILILIGLSFIVLGVIVFFATRFNIRIPFGRLPGDIKIQNGNFSFYFPITTCIIASVVLSLILWIFNHFTK